MFTIEVISFAQSMKSFISFKTPQIQHSIYFLINELYSQHLLFLLIFFNIQLKCNLMIYTSNPTILAKFSLQTVACSFITLFI